MPEKKLWSSRYWTILDTVILVLLVLILLSYCAARKGEDKRSGEERRAALIALAEVKRVEWALAAKVAGLERERIPCADESASDKFLHDEEVRARLLCRVSRSPDGKETVVVVMYVARVKRDENSQTDERYLLRAYGIVRKNETKYVVDWDIDDG